MQPYPTQPATPRSFSIALFLSGCLWIAIAGSAASRSAQGIATRLNLPLAAGLLEQAFFLFLLICGFTTIGWLAARRANVREINALPLRPTALQEFVRGSALGWGMLLVVVLPMMATGALHPQLYLTPGSWGLALLSLFTLALYTLALEVAFRGFIFKKLIDSIGPVAATILISLLYALASSTRPYANSISFVVTFVSGLLFSLAYLRTHGLWLGWGLHFAWDAAMAVLLGLPIAGFGTYNSLVQTATSGPDWLTGSAYGPEGAFFTLAVLLGAMLVLQRITRDYAWNYTHAPIVPAGYAVVIAPPEAHTAMEAAAAPAPLVQILSTTPTASSTMPIIDEHLRAESNLPPTD